MQEERKLALRNIIQRNNLAGLIFWRPDELVLTLAYFPHWGASFLVYREDEAVLFVPETEPEDILPEGVRIIKYPWGIIGCPDPWSNLYNKIRDVLPDKGVHKLPVSFVKNIGGSALSRTSAEQPPLPQDLVERLSAISEGGYKDCSPELLDLYAYKTSEDIVSLELTHHVAARAVEAFYKNAGSGRTESSVAASVESSVQEMVGEQRVRFARAWAMIQSGRNTAWGGTYNRSTGKKLGPGEMVLMELAVCVNGYWADITRMAQTPGVSARQLNVINVVSEAQALAISMMKPGINMGDLDAVARNHIGRSGFGHLFNHALGHQVGFRYHDPGAGLSPGSDAVLREGMVLTVEPGIYGIEIECGARVEDNILITADGYRVLS